jgi:hypothetical protein
MSNVKIVHNRLEQNLLSASYIPSGTCFTTADYGGDNIYMKVDVSFMCKASIIKDNYARGKIVVLSMATGRLRFIHGDTQVVPFKSVDVITTRF